MAAIRPIDQIGAKWTQVTPQRTQQYVEGVAQPLRDWKQSTAAANANWKTGIQQAASEDRFAKGVNRSSTAAWQQGVTEKGTSRWGQGVSLSGDKFATRFAPYANAIKAVNLPPRFARRDPRNLDRVKAIVDAMINTAKAQGG